MTTIVIRPQAGAGFFSNFNKVVSVLCHEVEAGRYDHAFVDWTIRSPIRHFRYGTSADGNIWERLFYPVGVAPDGDDSEFAGLFGRGGMPTGTRAYDMYKSGHRWRHRYGAIAQKYIRVRPEIVAEVDRILDGAARPMIGIHYRHPGHNAECPSPIPPVSEFAQRARKIARGQEVAIVLATDVEPVVDQFRAAFGANLIVQPGVQRSSNDIQRHERISDDGSLDDAKQVLVDALMLARCDVVVHVTSNIVTAVGYINPSLRMVYCETALEAWGNWAKREGKSVLRSTFLAATRMPTIGSIFDRMRG